MLGSAGTSDLSASDVQLINILNVLCKIGDGPGKSIVVTLLCRSLFHTL